MQATVKAAKNMKEAYDVVIIGSGFGGAITGCRLAEAGYSVCILERGKHYKKGEFPREFDNPRDWFWNSKLDFNGLIDFRFYNDVAAMLSSGVGGGSLIYANVHIRAHENIFKQGWPRDINRDVLNPYYDKVAEMLHVSPVPEYKNLPKTEAMRKVAEEIGKGNDWGKPDLAIYWGEETVEQEDPYGFGIDIAQTGCRYCGECVIGCNYYAKNTLDLNYIPVAVKNGAECFPLHEVSKIASEGKGYNVCYRDLDKNIEGMVFGEKVIVAAGSLGSTELLLRCKKQYKTLPKLSQKLGDNFSGNGDFLAAALNTKGEFADLQPRNGPTVTSFIKYWKQYPEFYLEEGGIPLDELVFVAGALRPDSDYLKKLKLSILRRIFPGLVFRSRSKKLFSEKIAEKGKLPSDMMVFLAMGRDAADGQIRLKRLFPLPFFPPKLAIRWRNKQSLPLFDKIIEEQNKVAEGLKGEQVLSPLWELRKQSTTVHLLGGCPMGDSLDTGVVNQYGEVFDYPNLYVADGSIIPTAIGPNPAMTIGALAERIAEQIIKKGME
ncbi:GMC family oxidoreductase [Candidatus Poribacteria bacterium]|nr:GMC family oxidoreductase [Candidatus Poribacteria bacterium]